MNSSSGFIAKKDDAILRAQLQNGYDEVSLDERLNGSNNLIRSQMSFLGDKQTKADLTNMTFMPKTYKIDLSEKKTDKLSNIAEQKCFQLFSDGKKQQEDREAIFRQNLEQRQIDEIKECTFKPILIKQVGQSNRPQSTLDVVNRTILWEQKRREKIKAQQDLSIIKNQSNYTYYPQIDSSQQSRFDHQQYSLRENQNQKGIDQFLRRQDLAKIQKRNSQQSESKVETQEGKNFRQSTQKKLSKPFSELLVDLRKEIKQIQI